ncbi:MAG: hypothetical protein NE327_17320 [Lentisphaeraceae bacterium]|nr:hypothetical protein [Lentisphaeraceae bacterium]
MTKQAKKYTGHFLLFLIIPLISYFAYKIIKHNTFLQNGKDEIVIEVDGTLDREKSFTRKYKFAHGINTYDARLCEEGEEPDLIINDGDFDYKLIYSAKGTDEAILHSRSNEFRVIPVKSFEGKIIFKNMFCGCEGLINLGYMAVGGIGTLILIVFATLFYYSSRKNLRYLILPAKDC